MPVLSNIFGEGLAQPDGVNGSQERDSSDTVDLNGNSVENDDASGLFAIDQGDDGGAGNGVQGGPDFAMEQPQSGGTDTFEVSDA